MRLPALLLLGLAFRGFLAALFLFVVLLFMGGQRVLNCVDQKSFIRAGERTLHPGGRGGEQSQVRPRTPPRNAAPAQPSSHTHSPFLACPLV